MSSESRSQSKTSVHVCNDLVRANVPILGKCYHFYKTIKYRNTQENSKDNKTDDKRENNGSTSRNSSTASSFQQQKKNNESNKNRDKVKM